MKKIMVSVNVLFILFLLSGSLHAQGRSISITNKTGMALSSVYISPAGQDSWHLIRSSGMGIYKDETFDFKQSIHKTFCSYDLKFRCDDGNYYYVRNLDMCLESGFMLYLPDQNKDK